MKCKKLLVVYAFLGMGHAHAQVVSASKIEFKHFTAGNSMVNLDSTSRIVILNDDQDLINRLDAPRGWVSKLRAITGLELTLVVTMQGITSKDIVLSSTPDTGLMRRIAGTTITMTASSNEYARSSSRGFLNLSSHGIYTVTKDISDNVASEGFKYKVNASGITLMFKEEIGALRGIQSLVEILMQDGRVSGAHRTLPTGEGIDYPYFEKRIYSVDVGRDFVPVEQLIGWMEKMSQFRIDTFNVHLNDDVTEAGSSAPVGYFRLATSRRGLRARDGNFYTRADWEKLEDAAYRYGINLVPEFDSPGHSLAWIQDDSSLPHNLRRSGAGNDINRGQLAVNSGTNRQKNADYMIARIMEYRDWFRGDTIHIGGDEAFLSNWTDVRTYLNLLYNALKAPGNPRGFKNINMWYSNQTTNGSNNPRFTLGNRSAQDRQYKNSIAGFPAGMEFYSWENRDFGQLTGKKWSQTSSYYTPMTTLFSNTGPTFTGAFLDFHGFRSERGRTSGGLRAHFVLRQTIPDGWGGALWNDKTSRFNKDTDHVNAGLSRALSAVGIAGWVGMTLSKSTQSAYEAEQARYERALIPGSQEIMATWISDRFPYLSGVQASVLLHTHANYREIVNRGGSRDTLRNGTRAQNWMAWDISELTKSFRGVTTFPAGMYVVDQPGEGNTAADGRICRDAGLALGERGISACDQDVWTQVISGSGGLTKQGIGSLKLEGANIFIGGVALNGGQLEIAAANNLGTGALTFAGGTLSFAGDLSLNKNIALDGTAGGGINANGNEVSLGGIISGGQLRIASERTVPETMVVTVTIISGATTRMAMRATITTGTRREAVAGKVVLGGVNTFSGLRLESGGLEASANTGLGVASGGLTFAGGAFSFGGNFDLPAARALMLAGTGTVDTNGNDVAIEGVISGTGDLVKEGLGSLELSGTNTYTGDTWVLAGTLIGDTGKIKGSLYSSSGATVDFNQMSAGNFAGDIFSGGLVKKRGTGILTFSRGSAADLEISAGTVESVGMFSGDLTFTGTGSRSFEFQQDGESTYSGVFSGNGSAVLASSGGRMTVTADSSSFAGIFEIRSANTIYLSSRARMGGVINVKSGGELTGSGTMAGMVVEGGGSFRPVGVATVTGDLTLAANARYLVNLGYRTHVMGDVNLNSSPIVVLAAIPPITVNTSSPNGGGAFVIMTIDGTRTGTFAPAVNLDNLPFVRGSVVYDDTDGQVRMAVGHNDAKLSEFLGVEVEVTDPVIVVPEPEVPEETEMPGETEMPEPQEPQLPPGVIMTQPKEESRNPAVITGLFDEARDSESNVELGAVLDNIILNLSGDSEQMAQAFDALAAEVHASAKPAQMVVNAGVQEAAVAQMRAGSGAIGSQDDQQTRFSLFGKQWGLVGDAGPVFWVKALASLGENPGDDVYKDIDYKGTGLLIGSDFSVGNDMRIGFFSGVGRMTFEQPQSNAEGTNSSSYAGLYGSWKFGRVLLRNGVNYFRHHVEASRVAFIEATNAALGLASDYYSLSYGLFTQIGFPVQGSDAAFEPFLGVNYMWHKTDAFSEQGDGIRFDLPEKRTTMGSIRLGLHALADSFAFLPNTEVSGGLSWDIALKNPDTAVVQAVGGFNSRAKAEISGAPIGGNSFTLQAGIIHKLGDSMNLQLDYSFSQSTQVSANSYHGLEARVSYNF